MAVALTSTANCQIRDCIVVGLKHLGVIVDFISVGVYPIQRNHNVRCRHKSLKNLTLLKVLCRRTTFESRKGYFSSCQLNKRIERGQVNAATAFEAFKCLPEKCQRIRCCIEPFPRLPLNRQTLKHYLYVKTNRKNRSPVGETVGSSARTTVVLPRCPFTIKVSLLVNCKAFRPGTDEGQANVSNVECLSLNRCFFSSKYLPTHPN